MIWTGYNIVNQSTHLFSLNADPEVVRENLLSRRTIGLDNYFTATGSQVEIWALTSDYDSKRIFFVDYK